MSGGVDRDRRRFLSAAALTVAVAHGSLVRPLPDAHATFVIEPESRSACVIVCVEVQPVVAPGASGPEPQGEIVPCLSSVIVNGPARVVLPVFTILYVYVISCPALLYELVDGQAVMLAARGRKLRRSVRPPSTNGRRPNRATCRGPTICSQALRAAAKCKASARRAGR